MELLLRTRIAIVVAIAAAVVSLAEILGYADVFSEALLAWALCLVLALRAGLRRRRGPVIAYALGALPATLALAALAWVTAAHG
jgi:beta-lactamase regulating signal transducer with metallopeptidase domain